MDELKSHIQKTLEQFPDKIIISKPINKNAEPKKIVINRIGESLYQAERLIKNQAFHENIKIDALERYIINYLTDKFLRLNAFTKTYEFCISVSKKGKAAFSKIKRDVTNKSEIIKDDVNIQNLEETVFVNSHNKEKRYILKEGQIIEPLIDMGIFTKEGMVVRSMYDKYRQINRFIETIDDCLPDTGELTVVDFGCGKGYLTFLLYYYLVEIKKIKARIIGLDLKGDVVESCNRAAEKYGYNSLSFKQSTIESFCPDFSVDMVISLHACDTATDYALFQGIRWNAKMIFAIPCCQHEINSQIKSSEFSILTRYGVLKENISSAFTDAIRGNLLTWSGYRVQLIDAVNLENTPKNIMIRAVKTNISMETKQKAMNEIESLCGAFDLNPTLLKLLNS